MTATTSVLPLQTEMGASAGRMPSEAPDASSRLRVMLLTVGLGVGGTEQQVLELASRLDRRRYDVLVCALKGEGTIASELRERGVRVITLAGKGSWDPRVLPRLFRVIRRESPDLVHAFLFRANVAARLVCRFLRGPIVVCSYRNMGDWTGWYHRSLDRVTARWSHAATCCSHAVRQAALARLEEDPGRFVTIHNGVDLARFATQSGANKHEFGLQDDLPLIGTICRLEEPRKGLEILLRAMAEMVASLSAQPCQLLITGEGPAGASLQHLCRSLGLSKWVVFAGARRDIAKLLPMLDVFVLPSLTEGFGIALVEAMAAGRPVVATSVGGVPEIVAPGETGLLVPPGDSRALAGALQELLRDPERARAFGRRGQARAEKLFTIEAMVKKHEALYESLAAGRGARVRLAG